jgi:hypothetical protein
LPVAAAAAAATFNQGAMEKARSAAQTQAALAAAYARKPSGGTAAAEITVNPFRSYPTSCLESPLAYNQWVNNPEQVQGDITLFGDPLSADANERNYLETDTITVFRLPCADGLSVTLLEIDRPSDASATYYPTLPGVTVTQSGVATDYSIRYSDDVNTFFATNYANSPLYVSNVYVLENYYNDSAPYLNYNNPFTLTIDNFASSGNLFDFPMLAYHTADYAAASQPLPISGHMSTNWANPDQSGEGIILQVYDQGNTSTRVLSFAWFTYDDMHIPFWIYGDTTFNIGARSVNVPTLFFNGGSFAGNLPAGVPFAAWGNVTFSFPNCTQMNVSYNGDASPNSGHKQGTKTFVRTGYVNGLVCI